jgi:hypothetical protein
VVAYAAYGRAQAAANALDAGDQDPLQAPSLDSDKRSDLAPQRLKIIFREDLA